MTDPLNDTPDEATARYQRRIAELELDLASARKQIPAVPEKNVVTRPEVPYFKRSDLRDSTFFNAHRKDILRSASAGRIIDDTPGWHAGSPESEAARKTALGRYNAQQAAKAKEGTR